MNIPRESSRRWTGSILRSNSAEHPVCKSCSRLTVKLTAGPVYVTPSYIMVINDKVQSNQKIKHISEKKKFQMKIMIRKNKNKK